MLEFILFWKELQLGPPAQPLKGTTVCPRFKIGTEKIKTLITSEFSLSSIFTLNLISSPQFHLKI